MALFLRAAGAGQPKGTKAGGKDISRAEGQGATEEGSTELRLRRGDIIEQVEVLSDGEKRRVYDAEDSEVQLRIVAPEGAGRLARGKGVR